MKRLLIVFILLLSLVRLQAQVRGQSPGYPPYWYFKDNSVRTYYYISVTKNNKTIYESNDRIIVVFCKTNFGSTLVKIKGNWPNNKTQFYIEDIKYNDVELADGTYISYFNANVLGEETHYVRWWSYNTFMYNRYEDSTLIILKSQPIKK